MPRTPKAATVNISPSHIIDTQQPVKLQSTTRLTWAFAIMMVLFAVMTALGVRTMNEIARLVDDAVKGETQDEQLVRDWLGEARTNVVRAVVLARGNDQEIKRLLAPEFEAASKRITDYQRRIEATLRSDPARSLFQAVVKSLDQYQAARAEVLQIEASGQGEAAARLVDAKMLPTLNAYVAAIQALADHERVFVDRSARQAVASAQQGRVIFLVSAAVILIMAMAILAWIVYAVTRPLIKSMRIVESISSGDLSRTIRISSTGEARRLIRALETLRLTLSRQVASIRETAAGINNASTEIAYGNNDLSRRTEAQVSALEQTAASLDTLTNAVTQNAQNAQSAAALAIGAALVAQRGGDAVRGVVGRMTGISEASAKISEITGLIDSIAFQTNLLSLNAAVEAARAGEQGKGFAVVAAEVRTLSQRSARAAQEVRVLVQETVGRVTAGAQEADAAGKTMEDIIQAVQRVSDLISAIAMASGEQNAGLQQISHAVTKMDNTTQQNAALVEQTAAAAEHMSEQVQALLDRVTRFKLADATVQPISVNAAAPSPLSPRHAPTPVTTNGALAQRVPGVLPLRD